MSNSALIKPNNTRQNRVHRIDDIIDNKFSEKIMDFFEKTITRLCLTSYEIEHCWMFISRNPSITMNTIDKFPDKPWHWLISSKKDITMEIIEKYPDKEWCWANISWHINITIEIIEKYPDKPWHWLNLSLNKNITMEIIEKFPDKPWNWDTLSFKRITMEFIEKFSNKPLDWKMISRNIKLKIDTLEKHSDKPWCYEMLSLNPSLTMEMIEKKPDAPWHWYRIFENPMTSEKEKFTLQCYREHLAAFRIQQYYMRAKYTPTYAYCRKLHKQFYDNFIKD